MHVCMIEFLWCHYTSKGDKYDPPTRLRPCQAAPVVKGPDIHRTSGSQPHKDAFVKTTKPSKTLGNGGLNTKLTVPHVQGPNLHTKSFMSSSLFANAPSHGPEPANYLPAPHKLQHKTELIRLAQGGKRHVWRGND